MKHKCTLTHLNLDIFLWQRHFTTFTRRRHPWPPSFALAMRGNSNSKRSRRRTLPVPPGRLRRRSSPEAAQPSQAAQGEWLRGCTGPEFRRDGACGSLGASRRKAEDRRRRRRRSCCRDTGALTMASAVSRMLDDLRTRGGLKGTDVANIAAVSPATVSRWTSGKAFPHPKTQLVISDLRYLVDRLAEFYSPDETRVWLYSKHPLLNGERAIDLIHAGRTDEVLAVIESLDQSTYT